MTHLLDTNAWITYLRKKDPLFIQRALKHPPADLTSCSVVLGELLYGAYHAGPSHKHVNFALVAWLRQNFRSLPFDDGAAEEYGKIRHHLGALGLPIGPNDMMIASIALANGLTVVAHNTSEFNRVPGLIVEDWQTP